MSATSQYSLKKRLTNVFGNKSFDISAFFQFFTKEPHILLEELIDANNKLPALDLVTNLHRVKFPKQPNFDKAPPSVYYHIPGTSYGLHNSQPSDPASLEHAYCADGYGHSMGCPIRLALAFRYLKRCKSNIQADFIHRLQQPNHAAAVEELLWANIWKATKPVDCEVPARNDSKKCIDWGITCIEERVLLEVKFRPSDWLRMVDKGTHIPGNILSKVTTKFPNASQALRIAAITGYSPPDFQLIRVLDTELKQANNIDGAIFATLNGEIWIFSLDVRVINRIKKIINPKAWLNLPWFYFIIYPLKGQQQREAFQRFNESSGCIDNIYWARLHRNIPEAQQYQDILNNQAQWYKAGITFKNGFLEVELIPKYSTAQE